MQCDFFSRERKGRDEYHRDLALFWCGSWLVLGLLSGIDPLLLFYRCLLASVHCHVVFFLCCSLAPVTKNVRDF
uniref:Uncharacterized protein n=1 Tax=Arundo donax TaxID=35708 RepID=A0A0A9D622_ARUDO